MSTIPQLPIVTFGEILLRFKSPGYERLLQSPHFETNYGGAELNVAVSLANFNIPVRFVTIVPNNPLGRGAIRLMKSYGIDISNILIRGERLGLYFLETGAGPRASSVLYDRSYSAFSECQPNDFSWDNIFQQTTWYHITGITPSLSASTAISTLESIKSAKRNQVPISCDLNYRKKLWNYGKSPLDVMPAIVKEIDVLVANEEDIQKSLGIPLKEDNSLTMVDRYSELVRKVARSYPNLKYIAITLRESYSATNNDWSAMLFSTVENKIYLSRKYSLTFIVDRVGAGDAFNAGLIYSLLQKKPLQEALDFAVATSALKHTIPGDFDLVSVSDVEQILKGDSSGRVQR